MRLFVALTFDEEARARIAALQERLAGALEKGSAVPPESLHLTLAFLGEVDEDDLESVEDALDEIVSDPVFELAFDRLGSFPGGKDGERTVWLGCAESEQLLHLQAEIEERLRRLGVEMEERPFVPHVTLVRRARLTNGADGENAENGASAGGGPDAEALSCMPAETPVAPFVASFDSYSLMESRRTPAGIVYERVCEWG